LCKNGVENVLVSLGADGILFLSKGRAIRAAVPAVEVKSTVGAGDSVLAGFIIGFMKESSVEECVRLAAACGTASAMQEGTKLATRETVQVLLEQITITELSK
jgi:fructose-1-phosphate kinase PfkB-like protein